MKAELFWRREHPSREHPTSWINLVHRDEQGNEQVIPHPNLDVKITEITFDKLWAAIACKAPTTFTVAEVEALHRDLQGRKFRNAKRPDPTRYVIFAGSIEDDPGDSIEAKYVIARGSDHALTRARSVLHGEFTVYGIWPLNLLVAQLQERQAMDPNQFEKEVREAAQASRKDRHQWSEALQRIET